MPLTQGQLDAIDSVLGDIQPHINQFSTTLSNLNLLKAVHDMGDGQGGNLFSDPQATAILQAFQAQLQTAANNIHTLLS